MASADAPSEAAIEAAIATRIDSAGFFEVIAEQLARCIYPELAPGLVPFGRRTDRKTIAGWPDAYLTTPQGRVVAVEATTAVSALDVHWSDDLEKLSRRLAPARRGGLVWAAWCNSPDPSRAVEMREAAAALGVPAEHIHILCRREICARLRDPVHADFLARDLGLSVVPSPFRRVDDVITQMTMRRSRGIFPTLEEYRAGGVAAPALLQELEATLSEHHAALVVGHGAAGKTTLAFLLAHRPRYRDVPRYYLDLARADGDVLLSKQVADALVVFAGAGVLFLVDNSHLEPDLAAEILAHWERLGRGCHLVMFTRRVRGPAQVWREQPELEASSLPQLNLIIGPEDLEGVYRRHHLALRGGEAPATPLSTLRRWSTIFGGDLMSFSAAVINRMERDPTCATVEAADARAYVRDRYLRAPGLRLEEAALLDLAAVAEVEFLLPIDVLPEAALEHAVRLGLVWVELDGVGAPSYHLAHPGLGTLLREAAGVSDRSAADRMRLLAEWPKLAISMARLLLAGGKADEARSFMRDVWAKSTWPLGRVPLQYWEQSLRLTLRLGALAPTEIAGRAEAWLAECRSSLEEQVFVLDGSNIVAILEVCRALTPSLYAAIAQLLVANAQRALDRFRTVYGLPVLRSLLMHLRLHMPTLERALLLDLAANIEMLVDRTVSTAAVWGVPDLLEYVGERQPAMLADIHAGLAAKSEALCDAASVGPLNFLAGFLAYAHDEIPELETAICVRLEARPRELGARVVQSDPQYLPALLAYAAAHRPRLALILRQQLIANAAPIARSMPQMSFAQAVRFLDSVGFHAPSLAEQGWRALEDDPALLLVRLLEARLGDLLFVIRTVRRVRPQLLPLIIDWIARRPEALVAVTLASPLDQLGPLMDDASDEARMLRQTICEGLVAAPQDVIAKALDAPPDQFAFFLSFARSADPRLAGVIDRTIESLDEDAVARLTYRFVVGGPSGITAACKQLPASRRIVHAIDAAQWCVQWAGVHHASPTWFRSFWHVCRDATRMDLVGVTAGAILRTARKSDFPAPAITLSHLTYILTSKHACTPSQIEEFFRERLPCGWIEDSYQNATNLAGPLRTMALDERPELRAPFCLPSLRGRADREWPGAVGSGTGLANWLQLLFAIRLLGLDPPRVPAVMTPLQTFAALGAFRPEDDHAKPIQAAVWGGLYEWCHLKRAPCPISPWLGEEMLSAFKNTVDAAPRIRAANALLAEWIEAGSADRWRLPPAAIGLPAALDGRINAGS